MAALESCPKHNMIAYLEKTYGNIKFHEIKDFLTRSSIYYALTISPVVSTTFVEQFWMSAKSKIINNVRGYINRHRCRQACNTISELKNVPVPLDHFLINAMTSKVLSFMVKKGKNFLGNVRPLFDSMLVQPTEDEGEASERPSESQPIPSPPHPSEDQPESQPGLSLRPSHSDPIPDSNPEGSGGNHGECFHEDKIGRKEIYAEKVDAEGVYYMETEDAHNEKGVSTEDQVSTVKPDEGTDKPKVSTDKIDEGTAELKNGNSDENATPTVFGDDETIAEFLAYIKLHGSLSKLKPLPKIDPKDKGKKVLKEEAESDAESEGVNEAKRKFAQLANDEEIARKVQEEWETEEKKKKLAEEEATKAALIRDYDDIQARIEADSILAARLQEEEREKFTIEERAKLLHDIIAAQRRFLAQQRAAEIRSRPPTRTQLRNQMMTYLKHVGGKKHSDLKTKNFEEIQVLYEKVKRSDENFIAIGSAEDERRIKDSECDDFHGMFILLGLKDGSTTAQRCWAYGVLRRLIAVTIIDEMIQYCLSEINTVRRYGSVKNHKNIVKFEQARTREFEEYKKKPKDPKPQSKSARNVKPQSKIVNHGQ
ncbi:hypothetical protein Tco_0716667 [Tanacetum coccineum]